MWAVTGIRSVSTEQRVFVLTQFTLTPNVTMVENNLEKERCTNNEIISFFLGHPMCILVVFLCIYFLFSLYVFDSTNDSLISLIIHYGGPQLQTQHNVY